MGKLSHFRGKQAKSGGETYRSGHQGGETPRLLAAASFGDGCPGEGSCDAARELFCRKDTLQCLS